MNTQLVRYETARTALAEAHRVDEVKDIRDKAQAMAAYAKQAKDTALVQWATEIKVRAERRAGEMLRVSAETGERVTGRPEKLSQAETLSDLGISRTQSSRWQQVASIPDEHFEAAVSMAKDAAGEVTTAFVMRQAKGRAKGKPKKGKAAQEALRQIEEAKESSMLENYLHMVIRVVKARKEFSDSESALLRDLFSIYEGVLNEN